MVTVWAVLVLVVPGTNHYLAEGRAAHDAMRYAEAESRLRLAREVPESTPEEVWEIYHLLARALAAQGRMEEVDAAFTELLIRDPHAPAPEKAPPRMRSAFRRAKDRLYPPGYVQLEDLSPRPGQISVRISDPWSRVREVVLLESTGDAPFSPRPLERIGRMAQGSVTAPRPGETTRYYVDARDEAGGTLASSGSPTEAFVFRSPAVPDSAPAATLAAPPRARRVVAWVSGIAALVATGAGAALSLSASEDSRQAGHPDTFGSDTRRLDATARQKALQSRAFFGGAALAAGASAVLFVWD